MSNNLKNIFAEGEKAQKEKNAKPITFRSEGEIYTEKAVRYNDAFFEIVGGQFDRNLVHIWSVIKGK